MRLAAAIASGRGRVLPIFGARTAASAPTLPLPLLSRKRAKARRPASARISERLPISSARRAAKKARTSAGVSAASSVQRRRAAEVLGKKSEKLQHVAPIGFDRLRRQPPLGAEIAEPSLDLGGDFGCDEADFGPSFSGLSHQNSFSVSRTASARNGIPGSAAHHFAALHAAVRPGSP